MPGQGLADPCTLTGVGPLAQAPKTRTVATRSAAKRWTRFMVATFSRRCGRARATQYRRAAAGPQASGVSTWPGAPSSSTCGLRRFVTCDQHNRQARSRTGRIGFSRAVGLRQTPHPFTRWLPAARACPGPLRVVGGFGVARSAIGIKCELRRFARSRKRGRAKRVDKRDGAMPMRLLTSLSLRSRRSSVSAPSSAWYTAHPTSTS